MKLEKIYEIAKLIGDCKIWAIRPSRTDSPFFQTMPSPLFLLKNLLEEVPIHEATFKEVERSLEIATHLLNNNKERKNLQNEGKKEEAAVLKKKMDKEDQDFRNDLTKRIPIWEDRINNELRKIKVVELSTDTILNPEKLSSGAKSFFEDQIWNQFSNLEKEDIEDGCRCISLQAWTPAGMITMRAIESALRSYYQKTTNNSPEGKMWGPMLDELLNNTSPNKKLIGYFDYLKDIRNSLQHPDARLSKFEANDVFHHAIHIFNTIYS